MGITNIAILPFFEEYVPDSSVQKIYTFCYICFGAPHKNVQRLFDAINQLQANYDISLAVTIENVKSNNQLLEQIENINKNAGKDLIVNRGLVSKTEVLEIYRASEALVFPSLKESIGLPLIEVNICGIKVLSADLPYSHEVLLSPIVSYEYYN